jgi:hypothetical protein
MSQAMHEEKHEVLSISKAENLPFTFTGPE